MIRDLLRRGLQRGVWNRREGRLIWADDWDICIILDGCRVDLWSEVSSSVDWLPSRWRQGWSPASCSPAWYGATFDPAAVPTEQLGVVTANPFAAAEASERPLVGDGAPVDQHQSVVMTDYVFQDDWGCEVRGGTLDVTAPETVVDRAWRAWTSADLDRLIVHLMQPHAPFRSRPEWFPEPPNDRDDGVDGYAHPDLGPIWERVRDGQVAVDAATLWGAYRDNLVWALEAVQPLVEAVDGDVLLTADHGQALGEWNVWGHPPGRATPQLRWVPWTIVEGKGTGYYQPQSETSGTEADRSEQLAALGYV